MARLEFAQPDLERFPCLALAYDAMREGGTMPAAMSAANEVAVEAFLNRRISFMDIPIVIAETMAAHSSLKANSLEAVLDADRWSRLEAEATIRRTAL
jgi:1-deoxy-D-xylulose-5-phosphate reductoisomerase